MRIGYLASRLNCNLSNYDSYLKCPERALLNSKLFGLYQRIVPHQNITFVSQKMETSANWTSENDSIFGALAHGMIDSYMSPILCTPLRAEFISFSTPFLNGKLCFYTKRLDSTGFVQNPWYFLTPFSLDLWISAVFCLIILLIMINKSNTSHIISSLPSWFLSIFVLKTSVDLIFVLYLSALRDILTEFGHPKLPFRTINQLAELVQSGSNTLFSTSEPNDKLAMINSAGDYRFLSDALVKNPIVQLSDIEDTSRAKNLVLAACKFLLKNPRHVLVEYNSNVLNSCPFNILKNLTEICPDNSLTTMASAGFKKHSKWTEKFSRMTELLTAEFEKATDNSSITKREKQKYFDKMQKQNVFQSFALNPSGIRIIFFAFVFGQCISIGIFLAERWKIFS